MPVDRLVEAFGLATPDGQPYPSLEAPLARAALRGETIADAEWRVRRSDGTMATAQGSARPILDPDGATVGAVLVFRDVSARRALEQQKEELLAKATHDLKTPLSAINGLAQLLLRRLGRLQRPENEQVLAGLGCINALASRMAALLNELLDVAQLDAGRPLALHRVPTELVGLAQRVAAEARQATERFDIRVDARVADVFGMWDAFRLERVLGNLLAHAVQQSPRDEVVVTVDREDGQGGAWAALTVSHRGQPIAAADLPDVFERFHRDRAAVGRVRGEGIGRWGVRQIVEQHGGTIAASSDDATGTTFTIRLPLSARDALEGSGGSSMRQIR